MDREKLKLKSDINEIVKKSALNEEAKTVLEKVFGAMADYEYSLLGDLKKIVEQEQGGLNFKTREQLLKNRDEEFPAAKWDKYWNIKIILADKDDEEYYKSRGFSQVDGNISIYFAQSSIDDDKDINDLSDKYYNHIFLNCPYEQIEEFCYKTYKGMLQKTGQPFSYQLTINNRFVEKEDLLAKIARKYKIDRPIIFSPYARHAVDIKIQDTEAENIGQFIDDEPDFKLAENGLDGRLILNHLLMWNIETEECPDEHYTIAANDRENSYMCEAYVEDEEGKTNFILPYGNFNDVCKLKESIRIYSSEELKGFKLLTINDVADRDIKDTVFANVFNGNGFIKQERLRTKRDIEAVLSNFRMDSYFCRYVDRKDVNKYKRIITRYSQEASYPQDQNELYYAESRHLPKCTILFKGSEKLLADYANYVLYYLEQNYPEFSWAGVYA